MNEPNLKLTWNVLRNSEGEIIALKMEHPTKMSIHRIVGCEKSLFFSCVDLFISSVFLRTEDFEEAERKAIELLKEKRRDVLEKNRSDY